MKLRFLGMPVLVWAAMSLMAPATAQQQYSFNYLSSGGYDASGIFTVSNILDSVGGYDITGISGSITGTGGGAITSLFLNPGQPNPSTAVGFNFDNVLFPTANPALDINGVLFTTTGGTVWNLWGTAASSYSLYSYTAGPGIVSTTGTMSLAAVPEPNSYVLMMAGLIALGVVAQRRRVRQK